MNQEISTRRLRVLDWRLVRYHAFTCRQVQLYTPKWKDVDLVLEVRN
jgi:hypothetical protein